MLHPHIDSLFQIARASVTRQHIEDFAPADPGYDAYVQVWSRILQSGEIPQQSEFDLSEVIGLTGWASPDAFPEPESFRQFRRFTSAVATALIEFGNDTETVRPGNYLARDLIIDADIADQDHFDAVRRALPVVRDSLARTNREEEFPFFTFAGLILAQIANDQQAKVDLASQLLQDDSAVRNNPSLSWAANDSQFLFGLTNHNLLKQDWVSLASQLANPGNDENLAFVLNFVSEYNSQQNPSEPRRNS